LSLLASPNFVLSARLSCDVGVDFQQHTGELSNGVDDVVCIIPAQTGYVHVAEVIFGESNKVCAPISVLSVAASPGTTT
jgi:hypothetical protein